MKTMTDEINDVLTGNDRTPRLGEALNAPLERDSVAVANDAERLAHLVTRQAETETVMDEWGFTDDGDERAEGAPSRTRRSAESLVECGHLAGAICGPCWIRARGRQRHGLAIRYAQSNASAVQPLS
jgi:hypothetical protein